MSILSKICTAKSCACLTSATATGAGTGWIVDSASKNEQIEQTELIIKEQNDQIKALDEEIKTSRKEKRSISDDLSKTESYYVERIAGLEEENRKFDENHKEALVIISTLTSQLLKQSDEIEDLRVKNERLSAYSWIGDEIRQFETEIKTILKELPENIRKDLFDNWDFEVDIDQETKNILKNLTDSVNKLPENIQSKLNGMEVGVLKEYEDLLKKVVEVATSLNKNIENGNKKREQLMETLKKIKTIQVTTQK